MLSDAPEPPAYLAGKILRGIQKEERHRATRQILVSTLLLVGSMAATILSVFDLNDKLSQSGFLTFASLFVSDFSLATANFRELAWSLVESFPAIPAGLFLGSMIFVIWFATLAVKKISVGRHGRFELFAS
jgi:hypothetical protein